MFLECGGLLRRTPANPGHDFYHAEARQRVEKLSLKKDDSKHTTIAWYLDFSPKNTYRGSLNKPQHLKMTKY